METKLTMTEPKQQFNGRKMSYRVLKLCCYFSQGLSLSNIFIRYVFNLVYVFGMPHPTLTLTISFPAYDVSLEYT